MPPFLLKEKKMKLHMLLLDEHKATMPPTIEIADEWGELTVVFPSTEEDKVKTFMGLHCFVEGPKEEIVKWLFPFDYVILGNGSPLMERFQIAHIEKEPV